jgi:hypothetical protein
VTGAEQRGWRVGHQGRDRMYYEELRDGAWERIDIDGEMLMGRAHHVIYFASPEQWLRYPVWARGRRDEIIARITSEFREPDYEYDGLRGAASVPASPSAAPPVSAATKHTASRSENRALLIAVVALLLIAAGAGWVILSGVTRGETYLPMKNAARRVISRENEPAIFWVSIGVYTIVGAGSLVLAALTARAGRRG